MSSERINSLDIVKGHREDGKSIYYAIVKSSDSNFRGNDGKPIVRTWVSFPMSERHVKSYLMSIVNDYESGMILSSNGSYINPISKVFDFKEKLENPYLVPDNINTLEGIGETACKIAASLGGNAPVKKGWKDGALGEYVLPNDRDFMFPSRKWDFIVEMLPEIKKRGLHQVYPEDLVLHGALKNDLDILAFGALMSNNPIHFLAETEISISKEGFPYSDSGQVYPALMSDAGKEFLIMNMEKTSDDDLKLMAYALLDPLYSLSSVDRDFPYENFARTVMDNMVDISQKAYEKLESTGRTSMLAEFDMVLRTYEKAQELLAKGQLTLSERESSELADEIEESIKKDYPDAKSYVARHMKRSMREAFREKSFNARTSFFEEAMMEFTLKRIHKAALSPSVDKKNAIRAYADALRLGAVRHLIPEEDYQSALKDLKSYCNALPKGVKSALVESGIDVAENSVPIKEEVSMNNETNKLKRQNDIQYPCP